MPCSPAWARGSRLRALPEVRQLALRCSERERESARIERDGDDICAAYLLKRELDLRGSEVEFKGEVSGVIEAGAFVSFGGELGDVYEGFLPARRMRGEYFRAKSNRDRADRAKNRSAR